MSSAQRSKTSAAYFVSSIPSANSPEILGAYIGKRHRGTGSPAITANPTRWPRWRGSFGIFVRKCPIFDNWRLHDRTIPGLDPHDLQQA